MSAQNYSPGHLRQILKRWDEFSVTADELRSIRLTGMSSHRRAAGSRSRHRRATLVADVQRALTWLAELDHDPHAYNLIARHYIQHQLTADMAETDGCSQRTIDRAINRGLAAMSEFLGWSEADDANPPDPVTAALERLARASRPRVA